MDFNTPAAFPSAFPPVPADPTTLTPLLHRSVSANQLGRIVLYTEDIALRQRRLMLIIKDCQDRLRWLAGRKTQILHQLDGYRKTKDFLSEMMEKVKSGLAVKDVYIEFSDEAPAPEYAVKVNNGSPTRALLEKAKCPYLLVTYEAQDRTATAVERVLTYRSHART